jgi:protease-4
LWEVVTDKISQSRHISVDSLNVIANKLLSNSAQQALALGLVDKLCYANEYEQVLRKATADPLSYVTLADYNKTIQKLDEKDANIAMIYAYGDIIDGKAEEGTIGSISVCKEIKKAIQNKNVKAIVLRVNSGGGSALASEVIWQQIEEAKKAGKVVVTSMGDYAASGGYYIACNSDAIVAQPNTLTGSIGVFGMIPNMQKMLKNKLGVTVDVVKTNDHADMMSGFRPMDAAELQTIQISIEEIYGQFIGRVAAGRKMTTAQVDSIGQGRVWAGSDAIKIGLVDQLGNIDDAVALAAKLANLNNYSLIYYPAQKEWYEKLLNNNKEEDIAAAIKGELGELYYVYKGLNHILDQQGVQARMPFEMKLDW